MTTTLSGYGVSVGVPKGWDARITKLDPVDPLSQAARRANPRIDVEVTRPFLHMANLPLPKERDSFGGGVIERMNAEHVLVALIEYSAECMNTALFAKEGIPRSLTARSFDRRAIQRIVPGQAGSQTFCHEAGRPFCLYVVVGSHVRAGSMVHQVNRVLRSLSISAAGGAG